MAEEVLQPVAKVAPIKMGQTLSSQAAVLTKLLKQDAPVAPAVPANPEPEVPKEGEPVIPTEPEPAGTPAPADNNLDDYDNPAPVSNKPLEPVAQYILNKLPSLSTRIKIGDEIKAVTFKDVSELPAGFEFADDATRTQFTIDVATQVGRARDALQEYKQAELQQNIQAFEAQEAKDVAADVAYLQRTGILDKFKYEEDDPNFNTDPAVKMANEIYDLYMKTNRAYAQKFAGSNRTFRISFRDAADKYFAAQARQKANDSQKATEQPKEEKRTTTPAQRERTAIAKQTGAPAGGEPKTNQMRARPGMRMDDINRLVKLGKI